MGNVRGVSTCYIIQEKGIYDSLIDVDVIIFKEHWDVHEALLCMDAIHDIDV